MESLRFMEHSGGTRKIGAPGGRTSPGPVDGREDRPVRGWKGNVEGAAIALLEKPNTRWLEKPPPAVECSVVQQRRGWIGAIPIIKPPPGGVNPPTIPSPGELLRLEP